MQREWIIMLKLELVSSSGYSLRCHLTTSYSINQLQLLIRQPDISLIELISNRPPPILILRITDKLIYFVHLMFLLYFG